jgi:two-component system heavy metal sensor histidine kinase CusS
VKLSMRFRLTAWYALVLLGALALFSGLIWFSLRQSLERELDRDLNSLAAQFEAYTIHEVGEPQSPAQIKDEMEEFCQALPPLSTLHLRGSDGFEFRHDESANPRRGGHRDLQRRFQVGGVTFNLELSASLRPIRRTLELLQILLLSLVPAVVLIASLGGAWLSRRALKPVDDVTSAARLTGIDNLSQRLPVSDTGDELQRLTEVWNSMLGRLEAAVNTLSQFSADASHELRTPLSVIRTSAELALRRARTPEAYRESLHEISAEAERMTQLVEDLLLLARTGAQPSEMPKEPLDFRDLLAETADQMRGLAQTRQITIRTVWPSGSIVVVSGNRAALRRLLLVLLDNAIKYSHPNSEVTVSLTHENGYAAATIEDSGVGISVADQSHIFQRFYQADKARRDGGFGLGLSLAHNIARAHATGIDLESQEGVGSRFTLRLPAARSKSEQDLTIPA